MKTIVQLNKWANAHTSVFIDVLRVATGLFLALKGLQFATQTQYLEDILGSAGNSLGVSFILVHYRSDVASFWWCPYHFWTFNPDSIISTIAHTGWCSSY